MAITNLKNNHLSAAEFVDVATTLSTLEALLSIARINLSPEDRQRYGSINEQNKLLVNKTRDYHNNQPALQTPHVDWVEFDNDFNSRANLENIIDRLESLTVQLKNAKILHDYDNYQAALLDYAYANFMAGTQTPGYETKVNDIKQFFIRTTNAKTPPTV
jgi:hypothetical protein